MKNPLGNLMKQAQQMQTQMQEAQEELGRTEVKGEAGGQQTGDLLISLKVHQRVADAENPVEARLQGIGDGKHVQNPEIRRFRQIPGLFPGPSDHGAVQIDARHPMSMSGQACGVASGTAGDVQHPGFRIQSGAQEIKSLRVDGKDPIVVFADARVEIRHPILLPEVCSCPDG